MGNNLSRLQRWAKSLAGAADPQKTTEITVETERVLIIRRQRPRRAWCPGCGCEVDMVGLAEAQALTGTNHQISRELAESRGWHFDESQDKTLLICLASLQRWL